CRPTPPTSPAAPSTSRSPACAASWKPTPRTRATSRPSAASATCWPRTDPRVRWLPANVWARVLKRRLPTSLWGRSLLIIVLPVLVMQVAVTWAFFDMHWQTVTARLSDGLAGDVAWASESYADDPTPRNLEIIADRAQRSMSLSVDLREGDVLPEEPDRGPIGVVDRTLEEALESRVDRPVWFSTTQYPAYVDIRVQHPDGVLRIIAPRERAVATQAHIFVVWLFLATILLMGVAILFIRNQVRAI